MVLGQKQAPARYDEETADEDNSRGSYTPNFSSRSQQSELPSELKNELNSLSEGRDNTRSSSSEDEDDALSFFQRLAEE